MALVIIWVQYIMMVVYINGTEGTRGIRVCISLNEGVTLDTENGTRDGSTAEKAYVIGK